MRSFLLKFGAGLAGILLVGAISFGGFSGSASASTPRGGHVTVVDKSCNSSAGGLVAVNALNCNDIEILNDVIDVALLGLIDN